MEKAALTLWRGLAQGKTVDDITTDVNTAYIAEWNSHNTDGDLTQDPAIRAAMTNARLKVYGDKTSKMHGLYGEVDLEWVKLITER